MNDPSLLPTIGSCVPEVVQDAAIRLHTELNANESGNGLAVLSRLLSDPRMKLVWQELTKTERLHHKKTEQFANSARVANSSWALEHRRQAHELREKGDEEAARLLEAEAAVEEGLSDNLGDFGCSEQDVGLNRFFRQACLSAINIEPVSLSDLQTRAKELSKVATKLQDQAVLLESFGMKREAQQLNKVASVCEEQSERSIPDLEADDPWIISRDRGDAEIRTYVVSLSIPTTIIFGSPLYGTLATVANVVFGCDTVTAAKVREWLR
jgi:hypothetical protein